MNNSQKSKREQRVLAWVNRKRAEMGASQLKRLLKGVPSDPSRCIIGCALGADVDPYGETAPSKKPAYCDRMSHRDWHPLPKYVADFARDFDDGRFPHLESVDPFKD